MKTRQSLGRLTTILLITVLLLTGFGPGVRPVYAASLSAVASLKAGSATYTSVKLTWSAVSQADQYQIYRSDSADGPFSRIQTQTAVRYTDTGLTTGQRYYYKVRAYAVSGSTKVYGAFSAIVSARPVPAAPGSSFVTDWGKTSIRVKWSSVSGATGYEIARASSAAGTYAVIRTVTSGSPYTDTGLTAGKAYYYKVRALHQEGDSAIRGPYCPARTYAAPSSLSNASLSWWYNRPSPVNEDIPATVSAAVRLMAGHYNVRWQKPLADHPVVYLTMDEGYEYETNTTEILDIAQEKDVQITFFITGSYLSSKPALVKRMIAEGHQVLNHTKTHARLEDLVSDGGESDLLADIRALETAFQSATGQTMKKWLRPPEGGYSERALAYLTRNGYKVIFWSFAYRDWVTDDQPDPAEAKSLILGELHNGSIILLHAVSDTNVAILPSLIDGIRSRGYEIALLS